MPTQQRPRSHEKRDARGPWQVAGRSGEQCPISRPELRPPDLTAENLEFMPEHHQLDVPHIRATATANKQTEQSPHSEVEEGEGHAGNPPSPRMEKTRDE
jgi:hypothetical protein